MKYIQTLLGGLLVASLAGCGGGGGGGEGTSIKGDGSVGVSGSVSKGLFANADITLWKVSPNGTLSANPLVTFLSSSEGRFSGDIVVSQGDLLYVQASAKQDGSSRMYCDMSSCGEATIDSLDTNNNGRVDFGEWFAVPQGFQLSGYAEYKDARTPLRINLLTHLVSEVLEPPITKAKLSDRYEQLVDSLQLETLPSETAPFDPSEANNLGVNALKDNVLMLGLLDDSDAFDLSAMVSNAVDHYRSTGFYTDDAFSLTEVSGRAVHVTDVLVERVSDELLPRGAKDSLSNRIMTLNTEISVQEDRLPVAELPLSPPDF